jgi:tetratricopeptide (TPR) repeat protein
MKTALTLLAVATAVIAPNSYSAQSGADPVATVVRSSIQESEGELSSAVQLHLDKGDALSSQLRFTAAAREYQKAADVARGEGHLPSWTSWKLANAHFNDDNLTAAAAALDRLADEASMVGDLPTEALAIYNSAWLYGKAGRRTETATRVTRLKGLLRSRYMPVAIRDDLLGRIQAPSEVAAF